ncbi:MAG: TolC family protein [Proteobacteria bacterium]|nr:TolC family protein [Pseudomonadota bacterium]
MIHCLSRLACTAIVAATLPARAQDFLPPADRAHAAIGAYAEVRAADSYVVAARENARALAAGPHDTQLMLMPLRRSVSDAPTVNGKARYGEWEVQLTRAIRLPGKAALDREAGAHGVAAAELRQGDAEHQAARLLLASWMGWLRADAAAAAARARHDSLARERDTIARRLQLGDAARRELDQIAAALAIAQADLRQADAELQAQRLALRANFPQVPLPERAPSLPKPAPLEDTPQSWIDRIVSRSHEIRAAEEIASERDALARRANADRLPDPTVGLRTFSERDGMERGLGLVVSIPFGGARRSAEARAQAAAAEAARSETEAMRRDIARDAQLDVTRAQVAVELWQAAHAARTANAASLARQHRAYELGEIGLAERLQAERLDAESSLTELRTRADAHEAALRVRVDSHELWHPEDKIEHQDHS